MIGVLAAVAILAVFGFIGTTSAQSQPLPTAPPTDEDVTSSRLAGPTRFGTAVEISQFEFPDGADRVFLARSDDFPDAVAGGILTGGPILLVPQCDDIPEVVSDELARLSPNEVIALGGESAICQDVLDQATDAARDDDGSETPTPDPSDTATPTETESTELPLPLPSETTTEMATPSESPSPSESESDPEILPTETETPAA